MPENKIEKLSERVSVVVTEEHSFSMDTLILADFSMPKDYERSIELGCGCGALSLYWYARGYNNTATAVDIQGDVCDLLRQSVSLNGLDEHIQVINADMLYLDRVVDCESYDLVACNPPYYKSNQGVISHKSARALARHEMGCTFEDIVRVSARMLKAHGRLCICQRPERLCDVVCMMRDSGIEPKRLRFVQQHRGKAPRLFLLEGKKGANPGLITEPVLLIESDELGRIYALN